MILHPFLNIHRQISQGTSMRTATLFLIMVSLVGLGAWLFPATVQHDAEFTGKVVKVIDGDSLVVKTAFATKEIRLYGIDCPEYRQPYSKAAKKYVQQAVYGKMVRVEPVTIDPYDRIVAVVFHQDSSLNAALVEQGLAWVSPKYCTRKLCRSWQDQQQKARDEGRKLWSQASPEAPWVYKRRLREAKRKGGQ
jgi:endonuclease YncB( thermonuclease family)